MAGRSILDADMATVAGWIGSGFAWWREELRGLIPPSLQRQAAVLANYARYNGAGKTEKAGAGDSVPVLVDRSLCIVRQMTLPPLSDSDLQQLIELDADRILPIPAGLLVVAARADPSGRTAVTVVAMPRDAAAAMLADLAAQGINPTSIGIPPADNTPRIEVDLSASLAKAGLMRAVRPAAAGWWAVAIFLFVLNIGLLVWRDAQSVARLEGLIAEQAPAVATARTIASRIERTAGVARQLAERRERQDALAALAAVTRAMPERAWVQRYAWDGRTIRLSGYKRSGADVVGALRKVPRFADVRAANAEAIAEVPTGLPFDVSATLR